MRILIVFAHPSHSSTCDRILRVICEACRSNGHNTTVLDLYAETYDPVLSQKQWLAYQRPSGSPTIHEQQLLDCNAVIWIFPTWYGGPPAILKGYLEKVWRPGIAFEINQDRLVSFNNFEHISNFMIITTFGAGRIANFTAGDTCRKLFTRMLRRHFKGKADVSWFALYGLDIPNENKKMRFMAEIAQHIARWPRSAIL